MAQNDTKATMQWYKDNHEHPPFWPDGMCLKICRTARNIASMFPSAVAAQQATPEDHRVHKVSDIRQGMVMYFDDPHDSNPYGHIVTVGGRVPGANPSALGDLVVWTNSVVSGKIVAVRADYFPTHWGDQFQFAATWLNGVELNLPEKKTKPTPPLAKARRIEKAIDLIEKAIEVQKEQGNTRVVRALHRDLRSLRDTFQEFS